MSHSKKTTAASSHHVQHQSQIHRLTRYPFYPFPPSLPPPHLNTACTVVKSRGLALTRDVKMNSNRLLLYLVITNRAWVLPRRRELAVLMDSVVMVE